MRPDDIELPRTRRRIGKAIDDEVQAHLDERAAELVGQGMSVGEASERARREFGDIREAREELTRIDERAARLDQIGEFVSDLATDARRAVRSLARRPVFALTAIGTLALGIGANAVMFGLVDRLLLSPPAHVRDADRIVRLRYDVRNTTGARISWVRASYPAYQRLAARSDLFDAVAAYSDRALTLAVDGQARELAVAAATPNYFDALGVQPRLGRTLRDDAADDRAVVLSYALWVQQFGASENVLGQKIQLGGEPFTVVGVAPLGFDGEGGDSFDAWIKAAASTPTLSPSWQNAPRPRVVFVFGRLRPDVALSRATVETSRLYRETLADAGMADTTARVEMRSVIAGHDTDTGGLTPQARVSLWLQGVAALVLIIAIANVMNLLLLRAMDRQRETAVCLALGISRARLIRHLTLESLVLALAGGAAAVGLALWLGPILWGVVLPRAPEAAEMRGKLALVASAAGVICAILMTVAPAIVQRAWSGVDALRNGARGATRRASAAGDVLVIIQVALTVVLLVGAGLFTRSMSRLDNTDFGFNPARIIGARLTTSAAMDTAARTALFARVEEALRRTQSVEAVASGLSAPFRATLTLPFKLPGQDKLPGVGSGALGFPIAFAVSPDFLSTLGVGLLRGRGLTRGDNAGGPPVMLIDATMARSFWPKDDPIGKCVQVGADSLPCTTIVGVVSDTKRTAIDQRHYPRYYLSIDQTAPGLRDRYFFVRSSRVTPAMVDRIRATIAATAPSAPFVESFPLEKLLDPYTQQWRLGTTAFVAFGVLATTVAAIGLFGVISFGVARREREFGIRRALGESRGSILRRVVASATGRSVVGLITGGLLAIVLARKLHELLFKPTTSDAIVFVAAAAVVLVVTVVASAGPASRAVRVDPMRALRAD